MKDGFGIVWATEQDGSRMARRLILEYQESPWRNKAICALLFAVGQMAYTGQPWHPHLTALFLAVSCDGTLPAALPDLDVMPGASWPYLRARERGAAVFAVHQIDKCARYTEGQTDDLGATMDFFASDAIYFARKVYAEKHHGSIDNALAVAADCLRDRHSDFG